MANDNEFGDSDFDGMLFCWANVSIGTLWWVQNTLWREKLPRIGTPESRYHPGLSLLRHQVRCLDAVPMLFGTTQEPTCKPGEPKPDCFYARGLSGNSEEKTYFGKLPKASLDITEFIPCGFAPVALTPGAELQGENFEIPRVCRNRIKPKLSLVEHSILENWMKRQGL